MRQDERDLEQLVEVEQRRHPAEDARTPPVVERRRRGGDDQVLHFRHIVVEFDALAVDVDDLRFHRDHAVLRLVGGIAHLGVRQDRQVVELDAVVLTVLHQLIDAAHEGLIGLARQAQDQVGVGFDLVAREAALQLHVGAEGDVVALDRLEGRHVDALHRQGHALVEAGVRQDLLGLVGPFRRVLGVLDGQRHRIAGRVLHVGDIVGDVDVALLDAEVGIAAEDVFDLLLGEPVDLAIEPLLAELRDLAGGGRAPVAEGAAEGTAPVGFPQADPALRLVCRHDLVEGAFEEGRRNLVEVAHAVEILGADEAAVGLDHADARDRVPGRALVECLQKLQERALALVMDRQVDLAVGPHEGFGLVGHVWPTEEDHDAGLQRLQATGNLERNPAIPYIGAEADDVGILQGLDGIGDAHALVERRQKPIELGLGRELLDVGLQQGDRIGQIVLAGEGIIDLDQTDNQRLCWRRGLHSGFVGVWRGHSLRPVVLGPLAESSQGNG